MTISRAQAILLGVVALLLVTVAFAGGRGFQCDGCHAGLSPVVIGIDAGPGEDEIGARLDAALVEGTIRIEAIEEKFEEDIDAFDEGQRVRYEHLRESSLEEAAQYLSEWSRRRRSTSGTGSARGP